MKSDIKTLNNDEYFDVWLYVRPYKHFSEEEWKYLIFLDRQEGVISEETIWIYSPDQDSGFDATDKEPPLVVLQELARRRPEIMALLIAERLKGS